MKKFLIMFILIITTYGCTIKRDYYEVAAIEELPSGECQYDIRVSTFQMFVWNDPQKYVVIDSCGAYHLYELVKCKDLEKRYGLDACK